MASASPVVSESKTQPETKSQKGAATRDQILNAASRLIHVQGYQSTSLDDVLRESGVGKGNFYYYFKSKEDLGYAIIDRIRRAFIERGLGPDLADAIRRGQRSGRLRWDADAARVAQFLVAGLEGAILLGKVTRDITVIERCVEELKEHLTLYRI